MKKLLYTIMLAAILTGCNRQGGQPGTLPEDKGAKSLLQGVWLDEDNGNVSFRVQGDTIYYTDSTSMPSYFRIYADSLVLGSKTSYAIVKQTQHLFWFKNHNGDVIKLQKSTDPVDEDEFVHDTPKVLNYTHQVKIDSVVNHDGARYHWYIAINPTKYKVSKRSYNEDGMEVENVYYDNIMHISVFQGSQRLFSSDFRKQMYEKFVPKNFLDEAILANMEYSHHDDKGIHFNATLCIPDGASCYIVESVIGYRGEMTMQIVEY